MITSYRNKLSSKFSSHFAVINSYVQLFMETAGTVQTILSSTIISFAAFSQVHAISLVCCYANYFCGFRIDSLSVLPSYITGPDATRILSICPSLQKAIKVGAFKQYQLQNSHDDQTSFFCSLLKQWYLENHVSLVMCLLR